MIKDYISPSQFNRFRRCKFSWYLKYVKEFPEKPPSDVMLLGRRIHKEIEKFSHQMLNGREKSKSGYHPLTKVYIKHMIEKSISPKIVESEIKMNVGFCNLKMIPDFEDAQGIIHEIKTTSVVPKLNGNGTYDPISDDHEHQVTFYSISKLHNTANKRANCSVSIDYIIKRKTPLVLPVHLNISMRRINKELSLIKDMVYQIEAVNFQRIHRSYSACRWCDYNEICDKEWRNFLSGKRELNGNFRLRTPSKKQQIDSTKKLNKSLKQRNRPQYDTDVFSGYTKTYTPQFNSKSVNRSVGWGSIIWWLLIAGVVILYAF